MAAATKKKTNKPKRHKPAPGPEITTSEPDVEFQEPPIETPGGAPGGDAPKEQPAPVEDAAEEFDWEEATKQFCSDTGYCVDWVMDQMSMLVSCGADPRTAFENVTSGLQSAIDEPRELKRAADKYQGFAKSIARMADSKIKKNLAERERKQAARRTAEKQARKSSFMWEKDRPLPAVYHKRAALPCPECRRVRLDNGGRAVRTMGVDKQVASLRCSACGYTWQLAVKEV